ncbi:MAG: IS3 family transposase [Bacteroidota bacterium]
MKKELILNLKNTSLSIRNQCELLNVSRSSLYYKPIGEKPENLEIMQIMDKHILEEPTAGVLTMQSMLEDKGIMASYERVRRLMRKANIRPIYPRRHLTVLGEKKYVHPYLLKNLKIERPNQVWEIDITYVPMHKGFMYLTAIIDVYSRAIMAWGLSNTLDAQASLEVVKQAIKTKGKPEILNSDQGSQFTCLAYVELLKKEGIKISMDGKGRALDNIYIERFWRTIKYQLIFLNPADDGITLYKGIKKWMDKYHNKNHQGINQKPIEKYKNAA